MIYELHHHDVLENLKLIVRFEISSSLDFDSFTEDYFLLQTQEVRTEFCIQYSVVPFRHKILDGLHSLKTKGR